MKGRISALFVSLIFIMLAAGFSLAADVQVVQPNGSELISQANGSYSIIFDINASGAVFADGNEFNYILDTATATVSYGATKIADLNLLEAGACNSANLSNKSTCSLEWNTSGINGAYSITVNAALSHEGGTITLSDSSDAQFNVDNAAPTASQKSPAPGSATNNRAKDISFLLSDAAGVNINSLVLTVNDTNYSWPNPSLSFDANVLMFDNPVQFAAETDVNISVDVKDVLGNRLFDKWAFVVDAIPPAPIDNLAYSLDSFNRLNLSWSTPASSKSPVSNYKVYRATSPRNESNKGTALGTTSSTSYTDATAVEGTSYYYYVASIDAAGNESLLSNELSATYSTDFGLTLDKTAVKMEKSGSVAVTVTAFNNTAERKCFELKSTVDNSNLKVAISNKNFCLNKNETLKTSAVLSTSSSISDGAYTARLRLISGATEKNAEVSVTVGQVQAIELTQLNAGADFCIEGYSKNLKIDVKNNSASTATVLLNAESELFVPEVEETELELAAGESRELNVKVNINQTTQPGDYTVTVFARSGSLLVQKSLSFTLEDCGPSAETKFSVSISGGCVELDKNAGTKTLSFTLKNLVNYDYSVYLSASGGLSYDLNSPVELEANGSYSGKIKFTGSLDDVNGDHKIVFYASGEGQTTDKNLCIRVKPIHWAEVSVEKNTAEDHQVKLEQAETFQIRVRNRGDFTEKLDLSIESVFSSIESDLSESSITLKAGETGTVFASVAPKTGTALGDKTIYLIVKSKGAKTTTTRTSGDIYTLKVNKLSENLNTSSIKWVAGGSTYNLNSSQLSYDSEEKSIIFEPSIGFTEGQKATQSIDFFDRRGNRYFLWFDFLPGNERLSNERIVLRFDDFKYEVDEGSIELEVNGITYSEGGVELNYNSTDKELVFEPEDEFANNETVKAELRFSDVQGNQFTFNYEFTVGSTTIREPSLKVKIGMTDAAIDSGTIDFGWNGSFYDVSDSQLSYSSSSRTISFNSRQNYTAPKDFDFDITFRGGTANQNLQGTINVKENLKRDDDRLEITLNELDGTIKRDSVEFTVNGETFDADSDEITVIESQNRVSFNLANTFYFGDTIDFELKAEDSTGDSVDLTGELELGAEQGESGTVTTSTGVYVKTPLHFKVIEADHSLQEGVIEIVNFPSEISLNPGEEKEASISIKNNSNETIPKITIRLWGLGTATYFKNLEIIDLAPGETRTVKGTLIASEATLNNKAYDLTLEARSDKFIATKTIRLKVGEVEEPQGPVEQIQGFVMGLVTFISSHALIGLGLLILVVVIIVIVLALKRHYIGPKEQEQVWLKYKP
ncbi:MAG: hypothetical protein V1494_05730 [Candidatus Diapherotrites archaeon]